MLRANRPILAYFDAIKTLRVRQLAMILKAGYDPNLMINSRGQNGLQFMVNYFGATEAHYRLQAPINRSAYLSIAKLLLDSGLDPNAMDLLTDETVLFDAIRFNDREMVSLLLNYVDLSLRNKSGETALMCAARFGTKQTVRLLLEHLRHLEMDGYFLRQRNRFGMTALELARAENLEAAKVLTKHLIAHGQHTGAVLARSSSHHQLVMGRPHHRRYVGPAHVAAAAGVGAAATYLRPAGVALARQRPQAAADLLDDYSATSDYSDTELMGGVGGAAAGHSRATAAGDYAGPAPGAGAGTTVGLGARPYYDPRAAELNQYLLEQQDSLMASVERAEPGGRAAASDDDDPYVGGAGGQLVRSRSCMLAGSGRQQQQQPQQKYARAGPSGAQAKKAGGGGSGGGGGEAPKSSSNWQD